MNDPTPASPRMTDQTPELLPTDVLPLSIGFAVDYLDGVMLHERAEIQRIWDIVRAHMLTRPTPAERPVPRCDVTLTERFPNAMCQCQSYDGNLGPCKTFEEGENGSCVFCDHNLSCHQSLKAAHLLNEVSDYLAATLAKPDPRAWDTLLIYKPERPDTQVREALEEIRKDIHNLVLREKKPAQLIAIRSKIDEAINAIRTALTARPSDAAVAVQDTWFIDSTLPIMGMSGDIESDRVLKLLFRRAVTDSDRTRLIEVLNAGEAALALPPDEPVCVHAKLTDALTELYSAQPERKALEDLLLAWDALPEGYYSETAIGRWLNGDTLKNAITNARVVLGKV